MIRSGMNMDKINGREKRERIFFAAVCAAGLAFYISQGFLYTWQALKLRRYFSDLYVYMDFIKSGKKLYSLAETFMGAAYALCGEAGVGILLALFAAASWLLAYKCLETIIEEKPARALTLLAALMSQCAFSAYVAGRKFYKGLNLTVNNFHSPTYNMMEAFAIGAMLCAFVLLKNLRGRLDGKKLSCFALCCTAATAIKPSFLFCMAPALLMFLIIDFLLTLGRNLKNEVLLGVCVLPGVAAALYQSTMLFDENSSIVFEPVLNWLTNSHGIIEGLPRAGVFALAVLLCYGYKYVKKHWFSFSYAVAAVGIGEYLALMETGDRAEHGNLAWSADIGLYFALLAGIAVLLCERKKAKDPRFIVCAALLLWQVVSGIAYYVLVFEGNGFWF